jgi:alpha-methylacyl-CoA racemase
MASVLTASAPPSPHAFTELAVRVSKGKIMSQADPVSRGKRSIALDLKSPEGIAALKQLVAKADVFIEPFRPGVVEKMGLGPDVLCALNPRLIYGRMTGFGQGGTAFEKMAGHDANYLALSGTLDLFRRADDRPHPPMNFAGDYAGGGVMLAMGTLIALIERGQSGKGQVGAGGVTNGQWGPTSNAPTNQPTKIPPSLRPPPPPCR